MLDCVVFFRSDFFADPISQLALDDTLFRDFENSGQPESLRFWESYTHAVILGALGNRSREINEDACREDGVAILRRTSGGCAVVVGQGCLNYSLILSLDARPHLRPVDESYRFILSRIVTALDVEGLAFRGLSDIAIGNLKISGNAQRRGRRTLLHHGTILYNFDIGCIERYLRMPDRQPSYRANRPHSSFVTNLPLGAETIVDRIAGAWCKEAVAV